MELNSGSSYTTDVQFNLDSNLQLMQAETTINDKGPVNTVMDYKGVINLRELCFKSVC